MTITAIAVAMTLTVSNAAPANAPAEAPGFVPRGEIRAVAEPPSPAAIPASERWRFDIAEKRPAALPAMYAAFGALQLADVYSTRRALSNGAHEVNPLMKQAAKSSGTMLAVKAVSGAASIYFAEKMWRKNRKGAVIMMAVINGATAAIVARNMRNARR